MATPLWIPLDKIQYLIPLEHFIVWGVLFVLSFLFYKFFLKKISEKRHKNLKERFLKTLILYIVTSITAGLHWNFITSSNADYFLVKIAAYMAVVTLFLGSITIIRMAQIGVYLYLFFMNMSHGVPRLLANMFTMAFSIVVFGLIASNVFSFHLSAVLASSAIFSLILGLALQDTLGNLFSGVALQIDKPFEIGDWLEVQLGSEKWTGQVSEITWRATFIVGIGDETILIPNKTIAQSQMIIYSNNHRPPRFHQMFRINFQENIEDVKNLILKTVLENENVLRDPEPRVLIIETNESWITLKIFYSLKDYGLKYRVGDNILSNALAELKKHKIELAKNKLSIDRE